MIICLSFLFAPTNFSNFSYNKSYIFERNWSKVDKEKFIIDYFDENWSDILQLDQKLRISLYNSFKKVNICKLRFKTKLLTALTLQISIFVKNSLINRIIKSQDTQKTSSY